VLPDHPLRRRVARPRPLIRCTPVGGTFPSSVPDSGPIVVTSCIYVIVFAVGREFSSGFSFSWKKFLPLDCIGVAANLILQDIVVRPSNLSDPPNGRVFSLRIDLRRPAFFQA
jgi:hypothetical protein